LPKQHDRSFYKLIALLIILIASGSGCYAQFEVSTGIDMSYPLLLNSNNSKVSYGQISFGPRVGLAYKPENTQFFPILNVSLGRTRLPLTDVGSNIAVLNFNYLDVMLNENFVFHFTNSEIYVYGGIGFSDLSQKGIKMAGSGGEALNATIDSTADITHVFPAMNIGFEYNYGESAGKDLYLTMGINFQYIMLLSNNNLYHISVERSAYVYDHDNVYLSGNVISPGFYLSIHYLLHRKKKQSMYL
jgi:hypothetical protein